MAKYNYELCVPSRRKAELVGQFIKVPNVLTMTGADTKPRWQVAREMDAKSAAKCDRAITQRNDRRAARAEKKARRAA
jgi:hypothetical protein